VAVVRGKFPAERIYGVTEITTPYSIEYFIKLEDDQNWRTIRVDSEGNIRVVEKFKKA